jgi:hypothetical protein
VRPLGRRGNGNRLNSHREGRQLRSMYRAQQADGAVPRG